VASRVKRDVARRGEQSEGDATSIGRKEAARFILENDEALV